MTSFAPRTRRGFPPPTAVPAAHAGDAGQTPLRGPPLSSLVVRGDGAPSGLEGQYQGRDLFLLLSGPSAAALDLSPLRRRGCVVMCVNNSWSLARPHFWVGVDAPSSFLDCGWKDPGVVKFTPYAHLNHRLRFRHKETGAFMESKFLVRDMPAAYFFRRANDFNPATFLSSPAVAWGTVKGRKDSMGIANARSVMLCAVRLAHWMGFSRLYLLGCDFHMPSDSAPYAFEQDKSQGGRRGNNTVYAALSRRFERLRPLLEGHERPMRVYNCNPASALRAFPHLPFEDAVAHAAGMCGDVPPTGGWYR